MKMDRRGHIGQYMGCLYYLSPWIKNLAHFANPTHPLFDRSASRLRDTIRGLSDLSMSYPEVRTVVVCEWYPADLLYTAAERNPKARLVSGRTSGISDCGYCFG